MNKLLLSIICFSFFITSAMAITVPTGIQFYIPITFTNNPSNPITAGTPLNFTFNAGAYYTVETCSLNNTELFFANGTVTPSWIQGNQVDLYTANQLCGAANTAPALEPNALSAANDVNIWFKTPTGYSWIGGSGATNIIYLGFAGNYINSANTLFSATTGVGEAPYLTCSTARAFTTCNGIYAKWDTGPAVFTFEDNFSGSSLNTGLWVQSTTNTEGSKVIIDNSMSMVGAAAASSNGISTKSKYTEPAIVDVLVANSQVTGGTPSMEFGEYTNNVPNTASDAGFCGGYDYRQTSITSTQVSLTPSTCGQETELGTAYSGYSANYIAQFQWNATGWQAGNDLAGGTSTSKSTSATSTTVSIANYYGGISESGGAQVHRFNLSYFIMRIFPPNGVMPSASFGSLTYVTTSPGTQAMSSDPSPSYYALNTTGKTITGNPFKSNQINFTGAVSGGVAPYTYNWFVRSPGSSSFTQISGVTTGNYLWVTNSLTTLGIYQFMLQSHDSAANVVNSITGSIILVAPPTVTISNNLVLSPIQVGQPVNITATIPTNAGLAPFSYNFIIMNSVTDKIITSYAFNNIYKSNYTITIIPPSAWKGNTIQANVVVNDSETLPATFNSVYSGNWLVNAQSSVLLDYGSTNTITYGQIVQAQIVPPIASDNMRWASGTNLINYQIIGQFNTTLPILSPGTYPYNAIDITQGITAVNNLVVNKAVPVITLAAPSNMLYSGAGGNIIVSIVDYNSQIPVNVYINNVNVGSTYNSIAVNTIATAGQYVIVANTLGNANYKLANISQTFNIWTLTAGTGLTGLGSSTTISNGGVTSITGSGGTYASASTGAVTLYSASYTGSNGIQISSTNVITPNVVSPITNTLGELGCTSCNNYNSMYIDSISGVNGILSTTSGQSVTLAVNTVNPLNNYSDSIGLGITGNIFKSGNQLNSEYSTYNSQYIDSISGTNGILASTSGQATTLEVNAILPLTNYSNELKEYYPTYTASTGLSLSTSNVFSLLPLTGINGIYVTSTNNIGVNALGPITNTVGAVGCNNCNNYNSLYLTDVYTQNGIWNTISGQTETIGVSVGSGLSNISTVNNLNLSALGYIQNIVPINGLYGIRSGSSPTVDIGVEAGTGISNIITVNSLVTNYNSLYIDSITGVNGILTTASGQGITLAINAIYPITNTLDELGIAPGGYVASLSGSQSFFVSATTGAITGFAPTISASNGVFINSANTIETYAVYPVTNTPNLGLNGGGYVSSLTGSGGFYVSQGAGAIIGYSPSYTNTLPISISSTNNIKLLYNFSLGVNSLGYLYVNALGPQGPTGPQGPGGPAGPQGPAGPSYTGGNGITVNSTTNVISVNIVTPGNTFFTNNQLNSLNSGTSYNSEYIDSIRGINGILALQTGQSVVLAPNVLYPITNISNVIGCSSCGGSSSLTFNEPLYERGSTVYLAFNSPNLTFDAFNALYNPNNGGISYTGGNGGLTDPPAGITLADIFFLIALVTLATRLLMINQQSVWMIMLELVSGIIMTFALFFIIYPEPTTILSNTVQYVGSTNVISSVVSTNVTVTTSPILRSVQPTVVYVFYFIYTIIIVVLLITDIMPVFFPRKLPRTPEL